MRNWQASTAVVMALISSICDFGCARCDDGDDDLIESGQYVLADSGLGVLDWLDGAQMSIDRAAKTATIRYTRDGTTYDVEFTLTHL